jgi:hypothetical protein
MPKPPAGEQFTPKQSLFILWYTTPGETFFNGVRSAEKAGYKGNVNTLAAMARENLQKPKLAAALRKRVREIYSAADLTAERVLSDIELVRCLALEKGDLSTALKASELHGKYLKLFSERLEVVHSVEDVEDDVLVAMANELMGKIDGLNHAGTAGGNGTAQGAGGDTPGAETTH